MKYSDARQVWHDAYYTGKENTICHILELGRMVDKSRMCDTTKIAMNQAEMGKVQSVISRLPKDVQGFGHWMYSPLRNIDNLDEAQEAVFLHFRYNYKGVRLTDDKLNKCFYLAYASIVEYYYTVFGNPGPFKDSGCICKWLSDNKGIKIGTHNWVRDWESIYIQLQVSCHHIDNIALEPVEEFIRKYKYNSKDAA